jgi:predicted alpha/beta-fold hydrolase
MNLRGAGAGFGLSQRFYHAGLTEDVRHVGEWLGTNATGSPWALVGFSLGANLVLKLAAEAPSHPLPGFDCVLAANPPIDLAACCRQLARPANRLYDLSFVSALRREVRRLHASYPELGPIDRVRASSVYEFDDVFTAPRNGFAGAEDYYARSSAGPLIPQIEVAGLVIHAADDPFIPASLFEGVRFPRQLEWELVSAGGHLGYVSRRPWQGDHRWLDARLAAWLAERWATLLPRP